MEHFITQSLYKKNHKNIIRNPLHPHNFNAILIEVTVSKIKKRSSVNFFRVFFADK